MFPIDKETFDAVVRRLMIMDLGSATIRQICTLAGEIEREAGEPMVHLEIGNPGLDAERVGVEAEIRALEGGVANKYPAIQGIPELKQAGSEFIKAFLDVDMPGKCVIPTVGSMQGSFTLQLLLAQRIPGKDRMLFINPGFPAHITQAKVLGIKTVQFDIYRYRGEALEAKLEEILSKGDITAMLYSNPNNPAWTNLTETELEIIGRLATKYDCIVLEDLAYFGMDFRQDVSRPGEPPFGATVARYTDNYILMLSGSKIFSYAGQRIALVCIGPEVYDRRYDFFEKFYEMPAFGDAYIFGVLYCASSGTSHSAQHAMAAIIRHAFGRGPRRTKIHRPLLGIWPSCRDRQEDIYRQWFPYRIRHGRRLSDSRRFLLHDRLPRHVGRRAPAGADPIRGVVDLACLDRLGAAGHTRMRINDIRSGLFRPS